MAHLRCEFFSETLGLSSSMTVILPQRTTGQIGMAGRASSGPAPVLYLLHGLSDDDTIWLRRTSIERYAADLGLAVVMPAVNRSFYTDEAFGGRYWTFVSEELPQLAATFFRISPLREDTFVAGLSMGGYGALKLALRRPERFAAAASLSGAVDVADRIDDRNDDRNDDRKDDTDDAMWQRIFGPDLRVPPEDDLFALLQQVDPSALPRLWVGCGTDDVLYPANRALLDACARRGITPTTSITPGDHEWGLWDQQIQQVLDWLPLPRPGLS